MLERRKKVEGRISREELVPPSALLAASLEGLSVACGGNKQGGEVPEVTE